MPLQAVESVANDGEIHEDSQHSIKNEFLASLKAMESSPHIGTLTKLEEALHGAYADAQVRVHIITGSLKASGKTHTEYNKERALWTGEIQFGGDSKGAVNDPVLYAFYEWRRQGPHDFMGGFPAHEHNFEQAIDAELASSLYVVKQTG